MLYMYHKDQISNFICHTRPKQEVFNKSLEIYHTLGRFGNVLELYTSNFRHSNPVHLKRNTISVTYVIPEGPICKDYLWNFPFILSTVHKSLYHFLKSMKSIISRFCVVKRLT